MSIALETLTADQDLSRVLLYFCHIGSPLGHEGATVGNAASELGIEESACVELVGSLKSEGLLTTPDRALAPVSDSPIATPAGKATAEFIESVSRPGVERRKAIRNRFVNWLADGNEPRGASTFLGEGDTTIGTQPIAWNELYDAVKYLEETGLLSGSDVFGPEYLMPRLTATGFDCAEQFGGDIADYVRTVRYDRGSTVSINQVSGSNIAIAGHDVSQQLEQSPGEIRALFEKLQAVESVLTQLALSDRDQERVRAALAQLPETDDEETWRERVKSAGIKVGTILRDATSSALGQALAQALLGS